MDKLYLSQDIVGAIREHARAALPCECVGLLFGQDDKVNRRVPLTNISGDQSRYVADPAELLAALRAGEAEGNDLLAIYHSHPNGRQTPSETDVKEAQYNVVHLIALPQLGALRAFVLGREVCEVDLIVLRASPNESV